MNTTIEDEVILAEMIANFEQGELTYEDDGDDGLTNFCGVYFPLAGEVDVIGAYMAFKAAPGFDVEDDPYTHFEELTGCSASAVIGYDEAHPDYAIGAAFRAYVNAK